MAILQALIATLFRSVGRILNTALGWATIMLVVASGRAGCHGGSRRRHSGPSVSPISALRQTLTQPVEFLMQPLELVI